MQSPDLGVHTWGSVQGECSCALGYKCDPATKTCMEVAEADG